MNKQKLVKYLPVLTAITSMFVLVVPMLQNSGLCFSGWGHPPVPKSLQD